LDMSHRTAVFQLKVGGIMRTELPDPYDLIHSPGQHSAPIGAK
jgi:hypothetical protein